MRVVFSKRAKSDWGKLGSAITKRILEKFVFIMASSEPLKYAEKLRDSKLGQYRFRIGNYRVIFDVEHDIIFVLKVGHRKDIYK